MSEENSEELLLTTKYVDPPLRVSPDAAFQIGVVCGSISKFCDVATSVGNANMVLSQLVDTMRELQKALALLVYEEPV